MVIDFHTHIFPDRIVRNRDDFLDDADFRAIYGSVKSRIVGGDGLLRAMDENGIDAAVVMGFPWSDADRLWLHNDYLLESASASGGRILPFCGLPVGEAGAVSRSVERARTDGFAGIGEVAFYSTGLTAETARILPSLFSAARKAALPVCVHVNEPLGHRYAGKYATDFSMLYESIGAEAGLPIILAHWGGGILFYELMPEVKEAFADVYYDTAASPFLYRDEVYPAALSITGVEKILFGSDYPLAGYRPYLDAMEAAPFSDIQRRAVMGENARKLLGGIK
ncbi:MAG TPA: amidohydrolase family protein [Spirochaetota bacterium]|nr:amidohydrolase family protein [Spirochaetota bacterium]